MVRPILEKESSEPPGKVTKSYGKKYVHKLL